VDSHQPVTFLSERMFQANLFFVYGGSYYFSCNVLKQPTRLFGGTIFLSCCFLPIPFAQRSSYLVKNIPTTMGRQEPCFLIDFEVMETTVKSHRPSHKCCVFFFQIHLVGIAMIFHLRFSCIRRKFELDLTVQVTFGLLGICKETTPHQVPL